MPQKFVHTSIDINSLGGSDILIDVLNKRGIINYINSKLGKRSPRAEYSYGDAILTWFIAQCRGARRCEEVYNAQIDLKQHPRFKKGMSPDALLYIFKQLAVSNVYYPKTNISEKLKHQIELGKGFDTHETNTNPLFNELLIDVAIKLGRLEKGIEYILDFDTTDIENKISHSRKWYKGMGRRAYSPALAMINKIPVYLQNRNGDSNADFNLTQTINDALILLRKKGIIIKTVRVDAAGYNKDFTDHMDFIGLKYVTRAESKAVNKEKNFIKNWSPIRIKNTNCEIGDTIYHFGGIETRIIVKKVFKPKTQKREEEIEYWGVITNDFNSSNEEIIKSYAKRGDSENLFRELKERQGFGWDILPMRKFENNTVYLYITALNYILFRFITKLFSSKLKYVRGNMKLKTFKDKFMPKGTYWSGDIICLTPKAMDYSLLFRFT